MLPPDSEPPPNDQLLVREARGLLFDGATVLEDLARRAPTIFATRLRGLVTEMRQVGNDLDEWQRLPSVYPRAHKKK